MLPTMDFAKSTSRTEMPPDSIRLPDRIKNGTAISGKLSMEVTSFCATTSNGASPNKVTLPIKTAVMATATGTLKANSISMNVRILPAIRCYPSVGSVRAARRCGQRARRC